MCVFAFEGASTALLGKEGAMACTVAVEESISEHYNNQIRTLMEADPERYEALLQVRDKSLKPACFTLCDFGMTLLLQRKITHHKRILWSSD